MAMHNKNRTKEHAHCYIWHVLICIDRIGTWLWCRYRWFLCQIFRYNNNIPWIWYACKFPIFQQLLEINAFLDFDLNFSGVVCTFVLGGFIFINFYRKEEGFVTDIPQTEDPHQVKICEIKREKKTRSEIIQCVSIVWKGCWGDITFGTARSTKQSNTKSFIKLTLEWFAKSEWWR